MYCASISVIINQMEACNLQLDLVTHVCDLLQKLLIDSRHYIRFARLCHGCEYLKYKLSIFYDKGHIAISHVHSHVIKTTRKIAGSIIYKFTSGRKNTTAKR